MRKKLFFTTAIVAISFVTNSASAENIDERIEVLNGETRIFNNVTANGITTADDDGGVIYNSGTITIGETSFFTDNSVTNGGIGGVIYNEEGKITISNSLFENNKATGSAVSSGGAIYNNALMDAQHNPAAILEISDSGFNYNEASFGGAIDNSGKLNLSNVSFIENDATFTDRNNGGVGGAIFNYWMATVNGGLFKYNHAFDGGAFFNRDTATISSTFTENRAYIGGAVYNEYKMTISDSAFTGNSATNDEETDLPSGKGGAIYNYGKMTIANTTFKENHSDAYYSYGGAIFNDKYGKMTVSDSVFTENTSENGEGYGSGHGGAISNASGAEITISNTTFTGNKTYGSSGSPDAGGAIHNYAGTVKITNSTFTDNETIGSATGMGGAIYNEGLTNAHGVVKISDSSFSGNRASFGGAIDNNDMLTLTNVQFEQNQAHMDYAVGDYGGLGGAIDNNFFGQITITDGSFINNAAEGEGGAIHNEGKISFSGNTVFEGNTSDNVKNDIYNDHGKIDITGDLTLDGGVINSGTITFNDTNLKAKLVEAGNDTTKLIAGTDATHLGTIAGSVNLLLTDDDIAKKVVLEGNKTDFSLGNALYNIDYDNADTYTVAGKKNADQIAESTGANANQANTVEAVMANTSATGNDTFDAIASNINNMLQSGNNSQVKDALDGITAMSPEAAPMIQQTQTQALNQVYNAVGARLSGLASDGVQKLPTDTDWQDATVWMQGLANHAKLNKTSKSYGLKSDTYGAAFGLEKKFENNIKSGIGYAYNKADVDSKGRDTDVKTHTAFVYGEYKPNNWFVNGIISYGWSDYKESKKVIGTKVKAKYDTETFGMQTMTGYDLYTRFMTFTPEVGLRYMHISIEHYTDSAGQKISSTNSSIITGVVGSRIKKTFETAKGLKFSPQVGLAMTYDLKKAHNRSVVALPNGSSYVVNGNNLGRFGVEVGGGLSTEFNEHIEVSLGYEGHFRDDYQDHSGLLGLKYKF